MQLENLSLAVWNIVSYITRSDNNQRKRDSCKQNIKLMKQ